MEPVRIKRCVVLLMVFALGLGISLSCVPQQSDKPAQTPQEMTTAAESRAPAEGVAAKAPTKPDTSDKPNAEEADAGKLGPGDEPTPPSPKADDADEVATDETGGAGAAVDSPQAAADEIEADDIPRDETPQETAKRLGPPLVEQPEKLLRLDKVDSIWLDKAGGRLIMVGEVCQQQAPLEMFVCLWHTKEHEAVLTARVPAKAAHAGLLALGAKVGNPVQFMPKYIPASGTVIDIDVIWKDENGKIQQKRAQEWIRNFSTKKPMQRDWVFAGSGFWTDESTGKKHYQAESGDFICVSNFSTAMLDLPVESTQRNDALMFEALTENIPPLGTPVTIVLKPRLDKNKK